MWQLGAKTANFTLEGHEKGVNCIDYYSGGDKPYLISGADDRLVKIWDYQVLLYIDDTHPCAVLSATLCDECMRCVSPSTRTKPAFRPWRVTPRM